MVSSVNKFGLIALILLVAVGTTYFFLRKPPPRLYINELMAGNSYCCPDAIPEASQSDDWIEIYNKGGEAVDLGGMYFSENKKKPLQFQIPKTNPELTTIKPGGFLLFLADGKPGDGVLHLDFKLDRDGEFVGLYNSDGRVIDSLAFGSQKENISFGRASDGGSPWKELSKPSPGKSNK